MRWPWQRREPEGVTEAQKVIDQLDRQQPEVTRLARDLETARQRNHFAEAVAAALRGAT